MWENELDSEYTPLRDNSSFYGKLRILHHRFNLKWLVLLIAFGFLAALLFAGSEAEPNVLKPKDGNATDNSSNINVQTEILQAAPNLQATATPRPILFRTNENGVRNTFLPGDIPKSSFLNGYFRFEGGPSATSEAPTLGSSVTNKSEVLKIEILNATIDAAALSKDLDGCSNLKAVILSNVFINGEFDRAVLPSIKIFIFQQLAQPGETKQDYNAEKLKSRIFFDKTPNQNWDLMKDVANLGTKIEFRFDGVVLLMISQKSEEIVLLVPFCDNILQSVSWTLSTLTLAYCNISTSSIPTNLLYFNVYKVNVLNGGNFTQIIQAFTRLTDFYAQIPQEVLNLSEFPPTLTTLAVIDTDLDYRDDYRSAITNLAVWYHLGPKVLQFADKIMSTVQRVAVFGIPEETDASTFLQKLLVNTTAQWIVMEEFKRNPNSNFPNQQWVEKYLTGLEIPETASNFLITLTRNGFNGFGASDSKAGRELTPYEVEYYHYVLLGWYKTTTFEAYQRIQQRKLANLKNNGR